MRAVIQRVTSAKVEVEGKVTGEIGKGFLILFGVGQEDTEADCDKLADKKVSLLNDGPFTIILECRNGEIIP